MVIEHKGGIVVNDKMDYTESDLDEGIGYMVMSLAKSNYTCVELMVEGFKTDSCFGEHSCQRCWMEHLNKVYKGDGQDVANR